MSHRRSYNNPFVSGQFDPDSPLSGDDSKPVSAPSPKKSKRGVKKRVVSIPIGDVEGSKSKGEAYPPSDSWAWRKYGQKPIKGSPYPRGYYRCSSSKGCPARKQVERSHVDPTTLVITYACDHNHSAPATKHHPPSAAVATAVSSPSPPSESSSPSTAKFQHEDDLAAAAFSDDGFERFGHLASSEYGWLADVTSTSLLHSPICAVDDDVVSTAMVLNRNEDEEESFFADLGELPECSNVFRQSGGETHARGGRCSLSSITCLGGTG